MKRLFCIFAVFILSSALAFPVYAHLVGDVDGNGKTNSADALAVLKYSVGIIDEIDKSRADVNSDGSVNSMDALIILKISIGAYSGPTEVPDTFTSSYTKDLIEPIMKTGKFTMTCESEQDGKVMPLKLEIDGKNFAATIVNDGTEFRLLMLDGKGYMVVPKYKVYSETEISGIDTGAGSTAALKYVGSEYVTADGKKYVCEHFEGDGSTTDYYYLDGNFAFAQVKGDGQPMKITSIKKGVNASSFSLKGLIKVDLSQN